MGIKASKPVTPLESMAYPTLKSKLPKFTGKTIAITGCTSGMGLVLARLSGELGAARVVMLNRDSNRAENALKILQDNGYNAVHVPCDLQSFDSVKQAGDKLKEVCPDGIDVLCNNAGVMGLPDKATGDGCDVQMQSNHLSHFLLTSLAWPLLEKAAAAHGEARVVNHSSGARKKPNYLLERRFLGKNGGNLGGDFNPIAKWKRYQQSKLANALFTYALHEKANAAGSRVKVLFAHPGATLTDLQIKTAKEGGTSLLDYFILSSTMKKAHSEEDGTCGIITCCCSADVESSQFYGPEGLTGPAVLLPPERNQEAEAMLWEESVATTGAKYPFE